MTVRFNTKIRFNGREYASAEEMPASVREAYTRAVGETAVLRAGAEGLAGLGDAAGQADHDGHHRKQHGLGPGPAGNRGSDFAVREVDFGLLESGAIAFETGANGFDRRVVRGDTMLRDFRSGSNLIFLLPR